MDDDTVELCAARVYAEIAALNDIDYIATIVMVQQIRGTRSQGRPSKRKVFGRPACQLIRLSKTDIVE